MDYISYPDLDFDRDDAVMLEMQNYQVPVEEHGLSNDQIENHFISLNREMSDRIDYLVKQIDQRLDFISMNRVCVPKNLTSENQNLLKSLSFSSFATFAQSPYIRDIRGLTSPTNSDSEHQRQLLQPQHVSALKKIKRWRPSDIRQLRDALYGYYSRKQVALLIQKKLQWADQIESISKITTTEDSEEIRQELEYKIKLNEEQIDQIKSNKRPEIFVNDDRDDPEIDWLVMSASMKDSHLDDRDCRLMWRNQLHPSINNSPWTPDEANKLSLLYQEYGNDWQTIADNLGANRLAWQCCSYYQAELNTKVYPKTSMTPDEWAHITEVISMCKVDDYIPWDQVMFFVQSRNIKVIKYLWSKYHAQEDSVGPSGRSRKLNVWNGYEDLALVTAVKLYGTRDWKRVALYIPGRDNRSCRERYANRLKYSKRTVGAWTAREDSKLLSLMQKYPDDCLKIAAEHGTRNFHQIRARVALLSNGLASGQKIRRSNMRPEHQHTYDFIPYLLDSIQASASGASDGTDNTELTGEARIVLEDFLNKLHRRLKFIYNRGLQEVLQLNGGNQSRDRPENHGTESLSEVVSVHSTQAPKNDENGVDDDELEWVAPGRPTKPMEECEVDNQLLEIFSSYSSIKPPSKSLVYRAAQDEAIYQELVDIICDRLMPKSEHSISASTSLQPLLKSALEDALNDKVTRCRGDQSMSEFVLPPNETTIRGMRGFITQQEYLRSIVKKNLNVKQRAELDANVLSSPEYRQLVHAIRAIFLWPMLLSGVQPPEIDEKHWLEWRSKSVADPRSTFYTVRTLQKKLTK